MKNLIIAVSLLAFTSPAFADFKFNADDVEAYKVNAVVIGLVKQGLPIALKCHSVNPLSTVVHAKEIVNCQHVTEVENGEVEEITSLKVELTTKTNIVRILSTKTDLN